MDRYDMNEMCKLRDALRMVIGNKHINPNTRRVIKKDLRDIEKKIEIVAKKTKWND